MIKLAWVLVLVSGCGQLVPNKLTVDANVKHELQLKNVVPYVHAFCQLQTDIPEELADCVDREIGKLVLTP